MLSLQFRFLERKPPELDRCTVLRFALEASFRLKSFYGADFRIVGVHIGSRPTDHVTSVLLARKSEVSEAFQPPLSFYCSVVSLFWFLKVTHDDSTPAHKLKEVQRRSRENGSDALQEGPAAVPEWPWADRTSSATFRPARLLSAITWKSFKSLWAFHSFVEFLDASRRWRVRGKKLQRDSHSCIKISFSQRSVSGRFTSNLTKLERFRPNRSTGHEAQVKVYGALSTIWSPRLHDVDQGWRSGTNSEDRVFADTIRTSSSDNEGELAFLLKECSFLEIKRHRVLLVKQIHRKTSCPVRLVLD